MSANYREKDRLLTLIRHSKYSVQKYTPADSFFGDFAHWVYTQCYKKGVLFFTLDC